ITGASYFLTWRELMIAKVLAQAALINPVIIPLVYFVSNLKMTTMPIIIMIPVRISSFEMRFLLMSGSRIAVNKVMDEKHTRATGTVDNLMDAKNKIQCKPTINPVKIN